MRLGESLKVNEKRSKEYKPLQNNQEAILFRIFYSKLNNPRFPSQPDVNFLGKLRISLPDIHLGRNRPVDLSLMFAKEEIKVVARNKTTNQSYHTSFKYPFEIDF